MTYKSLLVHLELNGDNEGVLGIAAELASRFDARVIGIAACQPHNMLYAEGFAASDVVTEDYDEIARELAVAEAQFRSVLVQVPDIEWRSTTCFEPLADFIADQARAADLIITGKDIGASLLDETRRANIGNLVMRAGRPILLVPQGVRSLPVQRAVIGWKDGREVRRAVADALPLLRQAGTTTILGVTPLPDMKAATEKMDDVAAWLALHGVRAVTEVVDQLGSEPATLRAVLRKKQCDLFVAGAYGHSRLGEWAFGGVTRDFLLDPDCCVLISH